MRVHFAVVVLLQLANAVTSAKCASDPALAAAYEAATQRPLSAACASGGDWWKPSPSNATTIQFISATLDSYLLLPCAINACRQDMDASAAALKAINCDEAQAAADAMTNVATVCQSVSIAPTLRRCTFSERYEEVQLPKDCGAIISTKATHPFLLMPLYSFKDICSLPRCANAMRTAVNKWPDCRADYYRQNYAGAPMSKKQVYLTYLSAFCDPTPPPPATLTPCETKLAALYATPFSNECNVQLKEKLRERTKTNYVVHTALRNSDDEVATVLTATPSCISDVAAVAAKAKEIGSCASNVSFGFQVLQAAQAKTFTTPPSPPAPVCDKKQASELLDRLGVPLPAACNATVPVGTVLYEVLYSPMSDLSAVVASPACVSAIVNYTTSTLPYCEEKPRGNDTVVATGIPESAKLTRYLLAAQAVLNDAKTAPSIPPTPATDKIAPSTPTPAAIKTSDAASLLVNQRGIGSWIMGLVTAGLVVGVSSI